MFNIESYITPILLSYVDKYVRDFKPADAQVSLWAGGVTLHNLVLKADVLQQEVSLPFTLVSGRIHELLIQVPWTKIMSEPIIVTINTIECILSLNPPPEENPTQEQHRPQVVEAPPGYMQALVRRIVSNIAVRVHSLIVKYVHDDIVLSLNVKKLSVDSVGTNWEPTFADIDQNFPAIRRLVRLDDLTLCLDKSDSDGKIRFYQEPLLYRCQLDLRVLTKLVSATKRRATNLSIQLRSSKLAWGVTNEQLVLLLRLLRERTPVEEKSTQISPKQNATQAAPAHSSSSSLEPRSESWSEWAWSWVPAWDREDVEETPAPPTPVPIAFTSYFEHISFVFKVMENEGTSRKRARGILELTASDAVVRMFTCFPSTFRVKLGTRYLTLASYGKCVCGHVNDNTNKDEATIYLSKMLTSEDNSWDWQEEDVSDQIIEIAVAADEMEEIPNIPIDPSPPQSETLSDQEENDPKQENVDEFWEKMAPVIYLEYSHDRSPSDVLINPYDNPPRDYQYSDWVENNTLRICIKPMLIQLSTGLLHRAMVFWSALQEVPPAPEPDLPMRTLTVEECDALSENLPQRRIDIDIIGLSMRVYPWDHSLTEKATRSPLALDLELPKATILLTGPLYPHRVCSAACQMPEDSGPLWKGAMFHITANVTSLQAGIATASDDSIRPCARADFRLVTHSLLYKNYFTRPESVTFSYTLKLRELNVCGSAPRLLAAIEVPMSLMKESVSTALRYSTLPGDVLSDEDAVAVDVTLEELLLRGFLTRNTNTHIMTMQAARAMAFHDPKSGELKQAWLFSAPEAPTITPYLRAASQWCNEPEIGSLEYLGIWLEPTALSMDPLFIAWLAYTPKLRSGTESYQISSLKNISSSQYMVRRRTTPPSSSGRGGSRSGSGAELVHVRPRSIESSSERSEKKDTKPHQQMQNKSDFWWSGDDLLKLHSRLNRLLITVETGFVSFYVTDSTVSAVDCVTVRDAMERHAVEHNKVLVFSFGRLSVYSNSQMKYLWHEIRHDGPTFLEVKPDQTGMEDSFPWKMRLADMSCYTLEIRAGLDKSGREKSSSGLRSQLKSTRMAIPRTVLEMVTTTVTLSVVTKSLQIKQDYRKTDAKKTETSKEEDKTKFFTSGVDFKPTSLKEFIRGPLRRKKSSAEAERPASPSEPSPTYTSGPVVSLGINLHADTPPIIVRLDQDQVRVVAIAVHCVAHIMTLLQRAPLAVSKQTYTPTNSDKPLTRSVSELERQSQSEDTTSENRSEKLISIYEAHPIKEPPKLKSFFWFQWVVSRATLVIATQKMKLAFDVDDIISSLDLQEHYNQFKTKIASASIRHYVRNNDDEWTPGALGGRVLEVREPTDAKEENHFLGITITQAQISNLPASWREELHPKLLERNSVNSMWEVYATLAPLEAVLQPTIMEHIILWLQEMVPSSVCPLNQVKKRPTIWQWPFCYITAGGIRLLIVDDEQKNNADDTFMVVVDKVTVNPHPENPICRRTVTPGTENSWTSTSPMLDGRQYEVLVKNLAIRSAKFSQLVNHEAFESEISKSTSGENPALKWSQTVVSPVITPVLHSIDVSCVLAPAVYNNDAVIFGPAVELNLLSDCAVEISVDRLDLSRRILARTLHAMRRRSISSTNLEEEKVCPYASLVTDHDSIDVTTENETIVVEEVSKSVVDLTRSVGVDSGVDTATSHSTYRPRGSDSVPQKKSVFISTTDPTEKVSDYLEVLVTMGVIELSLYVTDDGSPEIKALRPPPDVYKTVSEPIFKVIVNETKENTDDAEGSTTASRSVTGTIRKADIEKNKLELPTIIPFARKIEGNLPLLHITLQQPNLYFWQRRVQRSLQVSLFNAWVGLGAGQGEGNWNIPLITTAKGSPDPVTDIPPALAMLKIELSPRPFLGLHNSRGTIQLDVDRPVLFEVSTDRLRRLKGIQALMENKFAKYEVIDDEDVHKLSVLYKLRHSLVDSSIESITIQASQIGVKGSEGAVGWDSAKLQVAVGSRPDRVIGRVLISSLVISATSSNNRRHVVLQPVMMGGSFQATWDSWRRAESGSAIHEPTVSIGIDLDRIVFDLRPTDLAVVARIKNTISEILNTKRDPEKEDECFPSPANSTQSYFNRFSNIDNSEASSDHYYKDDLRSGAFKILSGQQLPMAYQVTLHGSTVSWRYPHPRAITCVIAFPIPGHNEEVECALELYCPLLSRWEAHTYFKLPVSDPRELKLNVSPTDVVFATTWRVRACSDVEQTSRPFEYDFKNFMPKQDPLSSEPPSAFDYNTRCGVSAEQLSGVLRIDSYFAPRLLPNARLAIRFASLEFHAYNNLPKLTKEAKTLEGYDVSRPLMRNHRVLSFFIQDMAAHVLLGTTSRLVFDTRISSDVVDVAMGTMEPFVDEFRLQGTVTMADEPRVRFRASDVRVLLHVPRVCTLRSLINDWNTAYAKYLNATTVQSKAQKTNVSEDAIMATVSTLEGRVSLWVHNTCTVPLRISQEGTDEVVPLGSGASLAYRWRSPVEAKKLRFALAGPSSDFHWSTSVLFSAGACRVKLEDTDEAFSGSSGVYLYVTVKECGGRLDMYLAGRLLLANMLRHNLLYKVRARTTDQTAWPTISSGELLAETVGGSVLCTADCEAVLKLKLSTQESGWSGDIPVKECRKENVPWLVKVPSSGEVSYMSVWCRVIRARSDGRVIASIWPFYVLRSHLPLDADVTLHTESGISTLELPVGQIKPPPIIQTAPGRGSSTHLVAPGTTSAHHVLMLQYRHLDCPITRDAIPLHYGVTDRSVFDKPTPTTSVDDIVQAIREWLERSGQDAHSPWPYSIVASHWHDTWLPASLQPRCDVTIRYSAVRIGGGCSLELQLCPVVLLANASPVALTLRAHDAAPLCKLDSGVAVSLPTSVLQKPFFMSVEVGRETFVSGQLQICKEDPGRYGAPPPGHVALDRASNFAIHCNQKVALLTLYYEIKEQINVLGITSTFLLINKLQTDIMVSAIAVPDEMEKHSILRPKMFDTVKPTEPGRFHGSPLCRFWVHGRWRGGNADELRTFLCLTLSAETHPEYTPVPVRLGMAPVRRAISLRNEFKRSVPVVVTQVYHEGRWVITIGEDPCPQFLVHNRTRAFLAIAQPVDTIDEPNTSKTQLQAVEECPGARWWCTVEACSWTHYSTPAHCARYPPVNAHLPTIPFLTVGPVLGTEESNPEWCQPVAMADGEQLLQLSGGVTIKVRVRTHPHSTLIELQDVDQHDISASDIRRRLIGPFSTIEDNNLAPVVDDNYVPKPSLEQEIGEASQAEVAPLLTEHEMADAETSSISLQNQESGFDDMVKMGGGVSSMNDSSLIKLSGMVREDIKDLSDINHIWPESERVRCVIGSVVVMMATSPEALPLMSLHLQRAALVVKADGRKMRTSLSILEVQIDNAQYVTGQYDFAVVATTRAEPSDVERWPALWGMFSEAFSTRSNEARFLIHTCHDKWTVANFNYRELTEVDIRVGPLALYIEDSYVSAAVDLFRLAVPISILSSEEVALAESTSLQYPLRLRKLHLHPLDLTLTLHTAVRMYIALDQSPLRLSAFQLQDVMTSPERLIHALTVHYLSAAILGAGWVVGGLELLGAPGALAARVGGASGGVRGVASAAAAALLKSLSACAGSLARNLDLIAGDEEHARRAAAARRRPPPSLMAGLVAGITNFAINILGAVGGLAHHPLVGVAVGETESGTAALRRGLLGAITKPLSATADLVAYAGQGLLTQTGWDPVPQPRCTLSRSIDSNIDKWRRDCVRWSFRLAELAVIAGFEAQLNDAPLQLLITHKFLVVIDPESERVVEMLDMKSCSLGPYNGHILELHITRRRQSKGSDSQTAVGEDNEYEINAAAMARVARYTGAEGSNTTEARVLPLIPAQGRSQALYAVLSTALHSNSISHLSFL